MGFQSSMVGDEEIQINYSRQLIHRDLVIYNKDPRLHSIFTTQHNATLFLTLTTVMASTRMLSLMLAVVLVSAWFMPGMSRDLPNQLVSDGISYVNHGMALSKVVMVHSEEAKKLLTCVGLNESCGPAYWCCDTNTCQFSWSEGRFRCITCLPTDLCLE